MVVMWPTFLMVVMSAENMEVSDELVLTFLASLFHEEGRLLSEASGHFSALADSLPHSNTSAVLDVGFSNSSVYNIFLDILLGVCPW